MATCQLLAPHSAEVVLLRKTGWGTDSPQGRIHCPWPHSVNAWRLWALFGTSAPAVLSFPRLSSLLPSEGPSLKNSPGGGCGGGQGRHNPPLRKAGLNFFVLYLASLICTSESCRNILTAGNRTPNRGLSNQGLFTPTIA